MSSTLPEPGDEIALPRRDYAGHDSVFCDELATVGWFSHSVTQHRKDLVGYGILQPTFRTSSCSIFFCKENLTLNPPKADSVFVDADVDEFLRGTDPPNAGP